MNQPGLVGIHTYVKICLQLISDIQAFLDRCTYKEIESEIKLRGSEPKQWARCVC